MKLNVLQWRCLIWYRSTDKWIPMNLTLYSVQFLFRMLFVATEMEKSIWFLLSFSMCFILFVVHCFYVWKSTIRFCGENPTQNPFSRKWKGLVLYVLISGMMLQEIFSQLLSNSRNAQYNTLTIHTHLKIISFPIFNINLIYMFFSVSFYFLAEINRN